VIDICRPPALAHVLDAARTPLTRPPSVPSAKQHAKNLNHLDSARTSLATALNDADSSVTSGQVELMRLKEEIRELEESTWPQRTNLMGQRESPAVLCVVAVGAANRFD